MPWVFIFINLFFSSKYLHFLLVEIHPGCAEFLLPAAHFANALRIIPIHPYRATARHSSASSADVPCEWKASVLCHVLLGQVHAVPTRVFSGYRVLPKRLFLVFPVVFHSDCAEELLAALLPWVYLFLCVKNVIFFLIYNIISVHLWWHVCVLLVVVFSALDFFFLLQLLIEKLQMCF